MNYANMSKEELIAAIEAANAKKQRGLTAKVSEKGALSVYGLGRFPVTLYKSQWKRLIAFMPDVDHFLVMNDEKLVDKV